MKRLRRIIFNALSVVSLLLFVATVVLWLRKRPFYSIEFPGHGSYFTVATGGGYEVASTFVKSRHARYTVRSGPTGVALYGPPPYGSPSLNRTLAPPNFIQEMRNTDVEWWLRWYEGENGWFLEHRSSLVGGAPLDKYAALLETMEDPNDSWQRLSGSPTAPRHWAVPGALPRNSLHARTDRFCIYWSACASNSTRFKTTVVTSRPAACTRSIPPARKSIPFNSPRFAHNGTAVSTFR